MNKGTQADRLLFQLSFIAVLFDYDKFDKKQSMPCFEEKNMDKLLE
jgi:hypothetical protein